MLQTNHALEKIKHDLPDLEFQLHGIETFGDKDHSIALEDPHTPQDIFTRELDQGVLNGTFDIALHSAKDLPASGIKDIDYFWLPWHEVQNDVLILRRNEPLADLKLGCVGGVSSARRIDYIKQKIPGIICRSIRGTIEERFNQLDQGVFDVILMAEAALKRLGLQDRITYRIPLSELTPPPAQGVLAVTFKKDHCLGYLLRDLYVKPLLFVGAGTGDINLITIKGAKAIERADCILYDALVNPELLDLASTKAEIYFVGKRNTDHSMRQTEITDLMLTKLKEGKRVVRLKGGDPSIFGRLREEVQGLQENHFAYQIIPGISALNSVTQSAGILLTARGVNQSFLTATATTETKQSKSLAEYAQTKIPVIFFMGFKQLENIVNEYLNAGWSQHTNIAVISAVYATRIVRSTLQKIVDDVKESGITTPALIVIGDFAADKNSITSPLQPLSGVRVLLPGEKQSVMHLTTVVEEFGGTAIPWSLIKLELNLNAIEDVQKVGNFDWIILTSPSAVRLFFKAFNRNLFNSEKSPKFGVTGPATARNLASFGYLPSVIPEKNYSSEGLVRAFKNIDLKNQKIFFPRSNIGSTYIEEKLRKQGAQTKAIALYNNFPVKHEKNLPEFDAILFTSPSSVNEFLKTKQSISLIHKIIGCIGEITQKTAQAAAIRVDFYPEESTSENLVKCLAAYMQNLKLKGNNEISKNQT